MKPWRLHQTALKYPPRIFAKWRRIYVFPFIGTGLLAFHFGIYAATLNSLNDTDFMQPGFSVNPGDSVVATLSDTEGTGYGVLNKERGGRFSLSRDVTVTSNNGAPWSRGIMMNGDASSLSADRLVVNSSGAFAEGIAVNGDDVQVELGSSSRINVISQSDPVQAAGIYLRGNSQLMANELSIATDGNNTEGLHIENEGTRANLGESSSITTAGRNSAGIYIFGANGDPQNGQSSLTASRLNIHTSGDNAYGINIQAGADVQLGSGSSVMTGGANAIGVWAVGEHLQMRGEALAINTQGAGASALEAGYGAQVDIGPGSQLFSARGIGLVSVETGTVVSYHGDKSHRNIVTSLAGVGASAQSGGELNLAHTQIAVTGRHQPDKPGYGLWAITGGRINGEALTIQGALGNRGVYATSGGEITLTDSLSVAMAGADEIAIMTDSSEDYGSGTGRIRASGVIDLLGGVKADTGSIDMVMQPGSVWTGASATASENGAMLNVAMTGSRWNMTGDSSVSTLQMAGGLVSFASERPGTTLTVGRLSGSGRFALKTDIVSGGVNNHSDKLVVTGASAGNHLLDFANQGSAATNGNERLTVVETPDGKATFTGTHNVELGGYLYELHKQGTDWVLRATAPDTPEIPPNDGDDVTPDTPEDNNNGQPETPTGPITSTADAGASFLNIGYLLNFAEIQTLMQRIGDLRQSRRGGNMWIRGYAGRFDSFSGGKLSQFTLDYSGTQFGADKRFFDDIPLYTGVFMSMTHGSSDYRSGDGGVKAHSVGVYGSWVAVNGFYSDTVLKYTHLKNSFNVLDSEGRGVGGQGNSGGVSLSVEAGRKFSLSGKALRNGFYLEPQAQLTWSHQNASHLRASNGLRIDLGSYESLLGRASMLLGYEVDHRDIALNVYLKSGYLHEFKGDAGYQLNGSQEQHRFRGGWWNNGLGFSAQFKQHHTLYFDVDSSTGYQFNQRQANLGYRYSF
ncbi:autotransporter outer membrane beta-barrel domain-containing protein [Jejubacter calystegiae]|uniref:Autotransporter outer membrane beta-barrel domain-containing protein n=2 Tax=Jejubacter calystegiae TaxID=2579935 RepID=A0A4P8YF59_9ENTR|nr:autotransporter outer membrane beta-barrel domain-containing protein [Jejubacter calystegiae]